MVVTIIKKVSIIGLIFLAVLISGCTTTGDNNTTTTTEPNYKSYNLNGISFHYPESWTVSSESENRVVFKTPNGETQINVYDNTQYPASYETFTITDTIGNVTYKKMPDSGDGMVSYAVIGDKMDFVMIGPVEDESGHEMILKSLKF